MSTIPSLLKLKDYVTLVGTTLGIIALISACFGTRASISLGFFLVVLTLATDAIDGYLARKMGTVNEIGKELDSLSDFLTFGVAPAVLTFQAFRSNHWFDFILVIGCVCFALGAMLRLARFNIRSGIGYIGIPTPLSALMMILFFYANYFYAFSLGGISYHFPYISYYVIPFIMILIGWFNITTFIQFGKKSKITYIIFICGAIFATVTSIIGILNPEPLLSMVVAIIFLAIFIGVMVYIVFGFIMYFRNRKAKKTDVN